VQQDFVAVGATWIGALEVTGAAQQQSSIALELTPARLIEQPPAPIYAFIETGFDAPFAVP
jgi:hypothetical protein